MRLRQPTLRLQAGASYTTEGCSPPFLNEVLSEENVRRCSVTYAEYAGRNYTALWGVLLALSLLLLLFATVKLVQRCSQLWKDRSCARTWSLASINLRMFAALVFLSLRLQDPLHFDPRFSIMAESAFADLAILFFYSLFVTLVLAWLRPTLSLRGQGTTMDNVRILLHAVSASSIAIPLVLFCSGSIDYKAYLVGRYSVLIVLTLGFFAVNTKYGGDVLQHFSTLRKEGHGLTSDETKFKGVRVYRLLFASSLFCVGALVYLSLSLASIDTYRSAIGTTGYTSPGQIGLAMHEAYRTVAMDVFSMTFSVFLLFFFQ